MEFKRRKVNDPVVISCRMLDHQTSAVCTEIVIQIIKYIVCQKQQIPYPYEYLKHVAGKEAERKKNTSLSTLQESMKAQRCNRKAFEAFESMENILQHLAAELESCKSGYVEEIMILLGATPVSPKEIYRIQLPPITCYCKENCSSASKTLGQFMRCIFMSEDLHDLISKPLGPTNLYVLVKKPAGRKSDWFLPKDQYSVPVHGHQAVFCFTPYLCQRTSNADNTSNSSNDLTPCETQCENCGNFVIYQDTQCCEVVKELYTLPQDSEHSSVFAVERMQWYQSQITFKGFKNHLSKTFQV